MSVSENKRNSVTLERYSKSTLAQERQFWKTSVTALLLSITQTVLSLKKGNIGG